MGAHRVVLTRSAQWPLSRRTSWRGLRGNVPMAQGLRESLRSFRDCEAQTQDPLPATACGFEPRPRHQRSEGRQRSALATTSWRGSSLVHKRQFPAGPFVCTLPAARPSAARSATSPWRPTSLLASFGTAWRHVGGGRCSRPMSTRDPCKYRAGLQPSAQSRRSPRFTRRRRLAVK